MKETWLIRVLLLIAYCVPFAYLSVKGDITSGTMLYYGVMIFSFAILYRCALKTNNVPIILFDGKAVEVRPDGMVLQAVHIPLSDRCDIGRFPHHPRDHRMEKKQKTEKRGKV